MTTNQEGVHAAVRAETGTSGSYLADWHALFDANAIATGPWGPRLLAWINQTLGTSYTDTAEAMQAFAVDQGFERWNDMNTLVLASSGALDLLAGADGLALDFTDDFFQADTGFYGSAAIVGGGTQDGYDTSPDTAASSLLSYPSASVKYTMGPSGTLRFGAHNYVTYTADGSQWTAARSNVATTNGVSDPNGETTAFTITATGASARIVHTVNVPISGDNIYNTTVWVRRRTGTGAINWEDPLVGVGPSLTGLTSSWKQFTYPSVNLGGSTIWYLGFRIATSGDEIDIAFPHIRRTPSDSTYLATTPAARYALPYEWDTDGVLQGIRVEEARTNLCLYSDDLTNAAWTKSNMTTAKTATGPGGVANSATTCTATAGNATALQAITSGSAARVTSVYLKRRTGTGNIDITQDNGSTWTTQAITSSWARYRLSAVTSTNPTVGIRVVTSGDAVDVALFDHEVGSFITSPIPTLDSTVTRAADSGITLATSAYPHSATVNTAMIEYVPDNVAAAMVALRWDDGTSNEVVSVGHDASANLGLTVTDGGAAQTAPLTSGTVTAGATKRVAVSWKANDFLISNAGAASVADTSGTVPTVTSLDVGPTLTGVIKKVVVFNAEYDAAALETLATP